MNSAGLLMREMTLDDANAAAELCGELGYPVAPDVMRSRIGELLKSPDQGIFVACLPEAGVGPESVIAWIHVCVVQHLQAEVRAEIGGLVVSARVRNSRIGRKLVARAEEWARKHGLKSVVVRSQVAREDAHRFYLGQGYLRTKTSAVFTKALE